MAVAFSPHSPTSTRTGELYLHLQLGVDCRALLPMAFAQEALIVVPHHFTLLPNQPAWVLGLFNYRNRILWGLDLPQFLGLEPLDFGQPEHHLVVMRPEFGGSASPVRTGLGLATQHVKGVARVPAEEIQPLTKAQAAQNNFRLENFYDSCKGLVLEGDEPLWVLDPLAIVQKLNSVDSSANP
ncbi:chemotaxis protein CheW [Thermostichus sp. OS-CIW-30]